jgi:hypothetical protein
LALAVSLLALTPTPSTAATFTGEIRFTVDGGFPGTLFDMFLESGDFSVYYFYESDAIDGEFSPANGNLRLTSDRHWLDVHDAWDYPTRPLLIVEGSSVSQFEYVNGPGHPVWYVTMLSGSSGYWDFDSLGGGRIFFSAPQPLALPEPHDIYLVYLVVALAVAIGWTRRRLADPGF